MKTASRYIICAISAFLSVLTLSGQTTDSIPADNDTLLNQYELTCKDCVYLKAKVSKGETVLRKDAINLTDRLVSLNSAIRARREELTPKQAVRFEAINRWFSTGTRPLVLDTTDLPQIPPIYHTLQTTHSGILTCGCNQVRKEEIEKKDKLKTYLLLTTSFPEASYGGTIALQYGSWGGYIKFRSNFKSVNQAYSCQSNGTINDGSPFWGTGNSTISNLSISGGGLYEVTRWLNIYGGIGYAASKLFWEDIDHNWALVYDYSHKGIATELGVLISGKVIVAGLGISSINIRTVGLDLSLGIRF